MEPGMIEKAQRLFKRQIIETELNELREDFPYWEIYENHWEANQFWAIFRYGLLDDGG